MWSQIAKGVRLRSLGCSNGTKGKNEKAGSDKTKTTASRISLHALFFSFLSFFYLMAQLGKLNLPNNLVTFFASLDMKGRSLM